WRWWLRQVEPPTGAGPFTVAAGDNVPFREIPALPSTVTLLSLSKFTNVVKGPGALMSSRSDAASANAGCAGIKSPSTAVKVALRILPAVDVDFISCVFLPIVRHPQSRCFI